MDDVQKLELIVGKIKRETNATLQRKSVFYFIRDIPYATNNAHEMMDPINLNKADCHAKSQLMKYMFKKLGYEVRILVAQYKLKDYPLEVRFIPDQIDYHYYVELLIDDEWVTLDATYDVPIARLGFVVNEWDGKTNTNVAEVVLSKKIEGVSNTVFDQARLDYKNRLATALATHKDEIETYQLTFNRWLSDARASITI
jgi:hypothetical protein